MSKEFEPKKLVPLLIKKYTEKSVRIRIETTDALKHLLKIFRIRRFLELLVPYLHYPHFNIKQEIMNLIIFSFLTSKGNVGFDLPSTVKALSQLLTDKNFKVRFIALEALAYITIIEDNDKILKLVKQETINNKHMLHLVKARFKLRPRVRLNHMNLVEYPNLDDNPEIM